MADGRSQGLAARRAALRALEDVDERGAWSTLAVPDRVGHLEHARDRALASNLAYEAIRWRGTLDWLLAKVSSRPLDQVEPVLHRILLLGGTQLLRTRVPARAAVDTSATLARESVPKGRAKGAAGFVNGILRALARQLEAGTLALPDGSDAESVGLRTAHPTWVVEDALARFGDEAEPLLLADNRSPGVTLRANVDRDQLMAELRAVGVDAESHAAAPEAIRAPGADPRRLAAVEQGRAVPQDAASMVVAHELGARPGDRVLDLCAGPGGKATHLAHLVGPAGEVVAIDQHAHRARLVDDAAARQGLANVTTVVGDALTVAPDEQFDRVLLDAPCTGLGVGRRRPEVRWRRTAADATALAEVQVALLVAAADRVAPGGRLTYSVCTWTAAETEGVLRDPRVEAALRGFRHVATRQLRPDVDDVDGMFVTTHERP